MKISPRKIRVSRYAAQVIRPTAATRAEDGGGVALAKVRQRWKAEYVEHGEVRLTVDGFTTFDEAIGALIRRMIQWCESPDAALDFIAGLFSDLTARSADVAISRAVWIAARDKNRRRPGVTVEFPHGMEFPRKGLASISSPLVPASPSKGGVA